MKLAILISMLLALPAAAGADVINSPSGLVDDQTAQPQRPRKGQGQKLRRALLEQFDVNGDGRLGPRERMRAVRVLRKIERRLAGDGAGPQQRRGRMRKFIERHDRNGDGQVGPREMPRGAAGKLRRLDRDGDGWVDEREIR
jgi:hypothetical protein